LLNFQRSFLAKTLNCLSLYTSEMVNIRLQRANYLPLHLIITRSELQNSRNHPHSDVRDKSSTRDIAGLFMKQGNPEKEQLGIIEIKQDWSYVGGMRM